jgi:hypothetical protein
MKEHPITPPPELVQAFLRSNPSTPAEMTYEQFIATRFARWGADQELEACCSWADATGWYGAGDMLRAARRPKPPSLKEQALQALDLLKVDASTHGLGFDSSAIRRALESLPG